MNIADESVGPRKSLRDEEAAAALRQHLDAAAAELLTDRLLTIEEDAKTATEWNKHEFFSSLLHSTR